ncbi:MAG: peptidoglycan DD-metalloendopeptidase family protein [Hyphomicrobiaceae bacterium]|nr:peptidoglycan DD-metalloendopeptidase family protein [Hyphomicrobiaceae bacterium]
MGAAALGGCSADIGRFGLESSSLGGDAPRARSVPIPSESLRRNAGAPVDREPPQSYSYSPAPYTPPPVTTAPVRQAGLPDPVARDVAPRDPITRDVPAPRARAAAGVPTSGTTIEVQSGDTIYGLSKRHRVSISELMTANGLQNPTIRPGQKLIVPRSAGRKPARRTEIAAAPAATNEPIGTGGRIAVTPAREAQASPPQAAVAPAGWTGTHTITPRDSLYGIARRYNVKLADLQAVNGITEPTRVRAGTVLKVPGNASPETSAAGPASVTAGAASATAPIGRPIIINSSAPERVAAVAPSSPVLNDASPAAPLAKAAPTEPPAPTKASAAAGAASGGKFRWPVKGRVVASFGPRGDNTHNDGINISVPMGTQVHAAEAGTVAYAGSELKGYGNLILVRHGGNWVSAYAHNDALLVKRGDKVERGQVIAKAGKSGAVDQPQVHFELRQGSKPVDPMPHLEK